MEFEPQNSAWLPNPNESFKTPSDEQLAPASKKLKKKIKMAIVYCTKCKNLIKEKHLFRIGDHFWHKSCLLCDNCTGQLDDNAYLIDEKLLCHGCYFKSIHAPKCCGCQRLMLTNEYAMYSMNNPYHLTCFKCCVCGNQINKGDRYIVANGRLMCKQDYEATRYQQQQQQNSQQTFPLKNIVQPNFTHNTCPNTNMSSNNIVSQNCNGVRKKTKITSEQRLYLERYYMKISNPTIKQRENIAQELNLPAKVIQTWFCNYRTKLKLQRSSGGRHSYDHKHSTDDHESNSSSRLKSMLHEQCLTPDQDYPAANCQISQSTEDHASPQDLSSDMSAGTYNAGPLQSTLHQNITSVGGCGDPTVILSRNPLHHSKSHDNNNSNKNFIHITDLSNPCANNKNTTNTTIKSSSSNSSSSNSYHLLTNVSNNPHHYSTLTVAPTLQ